MNECSICLAEINSMSCNNLLRWHDDFIDSIYTTTCGHTFHFNCIHDWLISNDDCPYCRSTLIEIDWDTNETYDILTEHCPNRRQPIWQRVTYFFKYPFIVSKQSTYCNKQLRGMCGECEDIGVSESSSPSRVVVHTRISMFGRIKRYIIRRLGFVN